MSNLLQMKTAKALTCNNVTFATNWLSDSREAENFTVCNEGRQSNAPKRNVDVDVRMTRIE